jgi:hypothetical protein
MGSISLPANTIGSQNIAIGYNALNANIDGSFNVAVGVNALKYNTRGSYNTAIGYNSDASSTDISYNYSTAIGYNSTPTGSNQIVLGTSAEAVYFPGTFCPPVTGTSPHHRITSITGAIMFATTGGDKGVWYCTGTDNWTKL